jgi:hypothetical protein
MSAPVLWVNAQKQTQRGRKTGIESVRLTNQRKEISSGEVLSISYRCGEGFANHPLISSGTLNLTLTQLNYLSAVPKCT